MTDPASRRDRPGRAMGRMSPVLSALFLAVMVLSVLRILVGGSLLDLVMNYRADQGSIVEKLHPTLYGFVAVAAFALASFRIALSPWETRVVRAVLLFLACMAGLVAYTVLFGIGAPVGFLIDNYVGACFSVLLFLFPPPLRRRIGQALLSVLILSAAVAILEFLLKVPILPHPQGEAAFRPVGLTSHPLELGLWCAVAVPIATTAGWSRRTTLAACLLLVGGLAVSGARTAMLAGGLCAIVVAVAAVGPQPWSQRRLERRLTLAAFAALALPVAVGLLSLAGALDRFQDGVADDSAASRVVVYRVFDYMSWPDMLFGIGIQRLDAIALDQLHLFAVESAVVVFVALFGVFGALIFAAAFLRLLAVLLQGARPAMLLGSLLYIGIALSNNALSSKEPSVFILICFVIAFRPPDGARALPSG